jgi:hypothetical protein
MNMQLHRKQVFMLVLAMLLAIASYWIPLPQRPVSSDEGQKLSDPVKNASFVEQVIFARESATQWRFPIAVAIPRTPQPESVVQVSDPRSAQSWVTRQWIDVREIDHDVRLGKPAFAPTSDRERSTR